MREFIVMKNGKRIKTIIASGNLQALCDALDVKGVPEFPINTFQGLLLAKVGVDTYMIFERTDTHAEGLALNIISQNKPKTITHKISAQVKQFFALPITEVAQHVV